MKMVILTVLCMSALPAAASGPVARQMLDDYREQGSRDASADRGKAM